MQVHNERKFSCPECESKFLRKNDLTRHMRTHTKEKPFKCTECDKSFAVQYTLDEHMAWIHQNGGKMLKCEHCDATFPALSGLFSHRIVHSDSKLYPCQICNKSFKRSYDWTKHNTTKQHLRKIMPNA